MILRGGWRGVMRGGGGEMVLVRDHMVGFIGWGRRSGFRVVSTFLLDLVAM